MPRYVRIPAFFPEVFMRVLWEAAVATLWTFVLMRYVVFEFVSFYPVLFGREPLPEHVQSFARLGSSTGAALILFILVARGASRVTRKDPRWPLVCGVLTGTLSVALLHAFIAVWFPPIDYVEVLLHLSAALVGGILGAAHGCRSHAAVEAGSRARLAIARAKEPDEVAIAIGKNLLEDLGKVGTILLWHVPPDHRPDGRTSGRRRGPAYELCIGWPSRIDHPWPIGLPLSDEEAASFAGLSEQRLYTVALERLPEDVSSRLVPRENVLAVPLATGKDPVGLLMIVIRQRWLSRATARSYLNAASQAAQQLTIFRQEERAEEAGMRGERERLADEIHDTIVQGCLAVGNRIEDVRGTDRLDTEDRKELALALKISRETVEEARLFVRALNTDDFSRELPQLIVAEAEGFFEETQVGVQTAIVGEPFPLSPNLGVVLFKVAREGLRNVGKHSRASVVDLVLTYDSAQISLEVQDNGIGLSGVAEDDVTRNGFVPETAKSVRSLREGGHGLKAIRRLVRKLGGTFSVRGAPGVGVTLSVQFDIGHAPISGLYCSRNLPKQRSHHVNGSRPDTGASSQ